MNQLYSLLVFFTNHWVLGYVLFSSFYFWLYIAFEISPFNMRIPPGYHILAFFTFLFFFPGVSGIIGMTFFVGIFLNALFVVTRDYTRYAINNFDRNPFEK